MSSSLSRCNRPGSDNRGSHVMAAWMKPLGRIKGTAFGSTGSKTGSNKTHLSNTSVSIAQGNGEYILAVFLALYK